MRESEFTRPAIGAAVAAWMGFFVGPNAVLSSTQGQFMAPLEQTFGLTRTMVSVVLLLSPLGVTLCLPAAGRAMDRWGLRAILLPGLLLFGGLHILMSQVHSLWQLVLLMSLISVAAAMHSSVGYAKLIAQWFDRRRGTVLGATVALGSGLGSALYPQLMRLLIGRYSWRAGYIGLGTLVLVLGFPILWALLREPEGGGAQSSSMQQTQNLPGATRAEALRGLTFWLIFLSILLTMTALLGTVIHAYPMLTERGFSPAIAATAVSCVFLGSIAGQLSSGLLLDAWQSPRAALPFFILALIGVLTVHSANHTAALLSGAVMLGTALGAENALAAYLTSRYFGLRAYGAIYGWAFAAACLGAALGLLLMGAVHDLAGDYRPMRFVFGVLVAVAVLCILLLGPYIYHPMPASQPDTAAPTV
jgi:sugar phosphate permease